MERAFNRLKNALLKEIGCDKEYDINKIPDFNKTITDMIRSNRFVAEVNTWLEQVRKDLHSEYAMVGIQRIEGMKSNMSKAYQNAWVSKLPSTPEYRIFENFWNVL